MLKVKRVAMKLLGMCLLLSSVISCQQDDLSDYEQSTKENVSSSTVQTKIYNQQQVDEKFSSEFFKSSKDGVEQSIFSSSGYQINTDYIKSLEYEDFHVLTYLVDYENDPELFVNLVFYSYDYKTYYPTVFKYDIKKTDYKYSMQIPKDKINVIPIISGDNYSRVLSNISTTSSVSLGDCGEAYVESVPHKCIGNKHSPEEAGCIYEGNQGEEAYYSFRVVVDLSDCFDETGGGGGGSTGGSPGGPSNPGGLPGGGIGGGGSTGGTRPQFPVKNGIVLREGVIISDPNIGNPNQNVKTLKAIQRDIKADLQDFNSNLNLTKEIGKGYQFKTINGVYSLSLPSFNLQNPAGQNTKIDISKAPAYLCGVFHTHPQNIGSLNHQGTPLFSPADLRAIFKFTNASSVVSDRKPSEAFIGVVNKYGAYVVMLPNDVTQDNIATKYEDFVRTNNNGRVLGDKDKEVWENMEEDLKRKYGEIESSGDTEEQKKEAHEKALLETMKKYGLEMNLYFLDDNDGAFNGSWQKVSLNTNGGVQYTTIN